MDTPCICGEVASYLALMFGPDVEWVLVSEAFEVVTDLRLQAPCLALDDAVVLVEVVDLVHLLHVYYDLIEQGD